MGSNLLVLCGPTYLSRLWCIVELFTFIHIGGCMDKVIILPVVRDDERFADAAALRKAYRNFDSERCLCFSAEDKRRMLEIIVSAFGDMGRFNLAVRALLDESALG